MFKSVRIVGQGRVGSALSARLRQRGVDVREAATDLVVLCVPDAAIASVAGAIAPGPWVAHVSGAVSLDALAPHERRFGVHPLQTFDRTGRAGQFDGAWGAITAENDAARERALWLAGTIGLQPFEISDKARVLYHAGAVVASNFLVTLHRAATRLLEEAGAPAEALVPLMRRTIDNGFDLTGPIARGDRAIVDLHLAAIHDRTPELERLYRTLAEATAP